MTNSATIDPRSSDHRRDSLGFVSTAMIGLVLVVVGLLVYRDFIFGSKTLLYTDIGSDSVNVFFPFYVHLSDYLRGEGLPSWSFSVGMGQSLFSNLGAVILKPVIWLEKGLIAQALVYQHLLYVVISGMLFAHFLAGRGLTFAGCLLGALLLSFSAYMSMGSCWYTHAVELLCFTFLLFAAEKAVGRGQWLYLVLAVAVIGLTAAFHLYLAAVLLLFYVPVRLIERYAWPPRPIITTCLLLATVAFLGVGLSAIVSANNIYGLVNSPRGAEPGSALNKLAGSPVFGLAAPAYYLTSVLRPFANDIMGTGNDFRGWGNYLEAPISYCGLLCLLLLPQIFVGANRRLRILYVLFLSLVLIPTIFPWFRYLFWLFQGDYYRTFSLFAVFGVITLSMTVFCRYATGRSLNLTVLGATTVILSGILYFPLPEMRAMVNPGVVVAAALFLLAYAILFVIGQLTNRPTIAAWIVVGLVAIELVYFDRITVADRPTVTKRELSERVGYNDYTVDAVRDIKATDAAFFRITKTWGSGPTMYPSLNDALVFGYYGTSSYSSFNNIHYIRFLKAVDVIGAGDELQQWSTGLVGHPMLSTFACEKYVLTDNPVPFQGSEIYEPLKRYEQIHVFRNRFFFPFGVSYPGYIREKDFRQLSSEQKPLALFHAAVISEEEAVNVQRLPALGLPELRESLSGASVTDLIQRGQKAALRIDFYAQNRIEGRAHLKNAAIMVFQMAFDDGWRALVDGRLAQVLKVDGGLLGVILDSGEHRVELRYHPPWLYAGAAITAASLLILGLSLWRWPRIRLPD